MRTSARHRRPVRRLRGSRLIPAVLGAIAVLVTVGFLVARGDSNPGSAGNPKTFVTRQGTALRVGTQSLRLVGFNLYDAAASGAYSCSQQGPLSDAALTSLLTAAHDRAGATVVRFWAYQTYTRGGTDWSGVDRVLRIARAVGMRVIPVLEDGPGNCTYGKPGQPKSEADEGQWYATGYRTPYAGAPLSYRDYVARIVSHYSTNPTILGWSMMNEAETPARDLEGRSQIVAFAADIAQVIRAHDSHHLITVGTQSNGAPGTSGADFQAIYSLPGIDFAEVHDYAFYGSDSVALPGSANGALPPAGGAQCLATTARIACSFAIARDVLHKPLLVGEAGIQATDLASRQRRAREFASKIHAALDDGASVYLVWQLNDRNTDGYGVLPTDQDPLFDVLKQAGG
jgi:mannan endo-1,4-beta-mannosidase